MASDNNKIYWDSCIFIDGLRKTPGRYDAIAELEHQAKGGNLSIYTSTLAIAEVAKPYGSDEMSEDEVRTIANYFRHKFIKIIPLDRMIARHATEIVRRHGLKPPDAIHVATALRVPCGVLHTYDGDGNKPGLLAKAGLIGGNPGLPIQRPDEFGNNTPLLFPLAPK